MLQCALPIDYTSHSMPNTIASYRRAAAADLTSICVIAQELNLLHHEAWPRVFAPATGPKQNEELWRESILDPDRAGFVAEIAGKIVGFITVTVANENSTLLQPLRYGRINSVCIMRETRGQGIGTHLIAEAEKWSHQHDAVEMRLIVWEFNTNALRLYRELGYGVRSLTMSKMLFGEVAVTSE